MPAPTTRGGVKKERVFKEYVESSRLQADDDFDHDGLTNGEEITISTGYNGEACVIRTTDVHNPDTDHDGYMDGEDLSPKDPYKNPVILLHGRGDNSWNCFGLANSISSDDNSVYDSSRSNFFDSVQVQAIIEDNQGRITPKKNSICEALINNGYTPNGNLFVFNYPNQDMTYINSRYLSDYIDNLKEPSSSNSEHVDYNKFYPTAADKNSRNVKFDLVGHSNGGLVARYYIENLGGSNLVRKLITIDTPHYGSWLAKLGLDSRIFSKIEFYPMNLDLASGSRLFTGNQYIFLDGSPFSSWTYVSSNEIRYAEHHQSPKLNGNTNIKTKYYAIAGAVYNENVLPGDVAVDFAVNYESVPIFTTAISVVAYAQYHITLSNIDLSLNDNVVDIGTQYGLKTDLNNIIEHINLSGASMILTDNPIYVYRTQIVASSGISNAIYGAMFEGGIFGAISGAISGVKIEVPYWHNDLLHITPTANSLIFHLRRDD